MQNFRCFKETFTSVEFDFLLTSSKLWNPKNATLEFLAGILFERVKEHIPACTEKFLKTIEKEKEKDSVKIMNAVKCSAIAKQSKLCRRFQFR